MRLVGRMCRTSAGHACQSISVELGCRSQRRDDCRHLWTGSDAIDIQQRSAEHFEGILHHSSPFRANEVTFGGPQTGNLEKPA